MSEEAIVGFEVRVVALKLFLMGALGVVGTELKPPNLLFGVSSLVFFSLVGVTDTECLAFCKGAIL